jgi:hypothetical protein
VGRRESRVGFTSVDIRSVSLGVVKIRCTTVNIVSVSHDGDLVVGQFGELGSDESGSSLGDVRVGKQDVEFFKRAAGDVSSEKEEN